MLQRILVPLDGSELAEQAIPVAARLARAVAGEVVLAHVVFTPRAYQYGDFTELDVKEAREYLETLRSREELSGVCTSVAVAVSIIHPAGGLLSLIEAQQIDLVVMCSHGYTGFKLWALGSVAEKVARHAPVPVLLLRQGGSVPVGTHVELEGPVRALVPLDGSVLAKAALVPAAQVVSALAAPGKGALHLTRVVVCPHVEQLDDREREAVMHRAKRYLGQTIQHIREGLVAPAITSLHLTLTWSVALDNDVASGILRVAESGEDAEGASTSARCDLIVMATHGYTGWQHLAVGSVTERVLHASRLPLLIVPAHKMAAAGNQAEPVPASQKAGRSTSH
ncbi:MAG TPA: universal stress protein [Ktedonobacteraceae bacterium]|nr:universal stress protein [Ktedonobacteraceae bacterium]